MQVQLHDNLATPSHRRDRFIVDRLEERLDRYSTRIHRTVVSLSETGADSGIPETRCRIAANLGSLGMVVATADDDGVHQAFSGALRQITRSIQRRIERRSNRQRPERSR